MGVNEASLRLYPQSSAPLEGLFADPPREYRGAPLWSWNCRLEIPQLRKQIDDLHAMGMGGFHIHVRTGLDTEYLGDEFMAAVRACTNRAAELGMRCYLYDEDRWPSGFAGGKVTEDPAHRAKYLLWTRRPYGAGAEALRNVSLSVGKRNEKGRFLAAYEIERRDGALVFSRPLSEAEARVRSEAGSDIWFAYQESPEPSDWYNGQTYVDTLSPAAVARFIEVTHERYCEVVGDHFGTVIPSIFTDEPQIVQKERFAHPEEDRDLCVPWTSDLPETFRAAHGFDLMERLPELFWDLPKGVPSKARWAYHDHVCERFTRAFPDQIGDWCARNGIVLTGHVLMEESLDLQTLGLGEAMRSFRSYGIPGIDMLCDKVELTTAKQAQSAARQFGCPGVMSELYGVTNWDFPFAGHKRQGDWQAALGVTLRVPHLTWVSMAGEAKRDYPASIGYQSTWYKRYPLVEDHFARVNAVMTRGEPVCRVGVIHPIESHWLDFGPLSTNGERASQREEEFQALARTLIHGLIDFDYISESLLADMPPQPATGGFRVGEMEYDVVIVSGLTTIRGSTLERLETFSGPILFLGEAPSLVGVEPSLRPAVLAQRQRSITIASLLPALEEFRSVDALDIRGNRPPDLVHQLRDENGTRYLFVSRLGRDVEDPRIVLSLEGTGGIVCFDTATGEMTESPVKVAGGITSVEVALHEGGSVLLALSPVWPPVTAGPERASRFQELGPIAGPLPVALSEPNVLLLDQAMFALDEGDWEGPEELLRIENIVRTRCGLGPSDGQVKQPWADPEPPPQLAWVRLRFKIECRVPVQASPPDALERPEETLIWLDGMEVPWRSDSMGVDAVDAIYGGRHQTYFVDEAIPIGRFPDLGVGEHDLELEFAFDRKRTIEWTYLLGDFGVELMGRRAVLTKPVRTLEWGDWTRQGLPFYAGNVTYHCSFEVAKQPLKIVFPQFRAPLLEVKEDDCRWIPVVFPPYEIELHQLDRTWFIEPGQRTRWGVSVTAYGSRVNAFGPLHNCDPNLLWVGPWAWRSEGDAWTYEYRLRPCGILAAPLLWGAAAEDGG